MRRLTYLAAAAAATAALALIPLLAASSASAATTTKPPATLTGYSPNWSGYVMTANKGRPGFNRVYAEFTVPMVSGGDVLRPDYATSGLWGEAAFWVGLGGATSASQLDQVGVLAYMTSRKGAPQYAAFSETYPDPRANVVLMKLNLVVNGDGIASGNGITIHPGDKMALQLDKGPGYNLSSNSYQVFVLDLTQDMYGSAVVTPPKTGSKRATDRTAEVITEAVGGGPGVKSANHDGYLGSGTVNYRNVDASIAAGYPDGQTYGIAPSPFWTAKALTLGDIDVAKYPTGLWYFFNKITWPSTLSHPGSVNPQGGGGTGDQNFSTYTNTSWSGRPRAN